MRPRTYLLIVLCLLVALVGQCAGSPDQRATAPQAVSAAAVGCDPEGIAP